MARFSRRRRRRTSNWLPVLGDRHGPDGQSGQEQYRFSSFTVPWGLIGTNGEGAVTVRTLTLDEPRNLDIAEPGLDLVETMADVERSAYMLDGIVGTVVNATDPYDEGDVENNPNAPPALVVGIGFRVSEWDSHSDTSEDALYNEVLNAENYARSRWIWRRVWYLSNNFTAGILPASWGSGNELQYLDAFPYGVPGINGGYAGGQEATNITAKSKRRVSNDERLVVCVHVAALPLSIGNRVDSFTTNHTGVSLFDIRILGHMVRNKPGARG